MPNRNRKQPRRSRTARSNALYQHIPTSATKYVGPLTTTVDSTVSTFYRDVSISTSAGGVVSATYNNDPSTTTNWSNYTGSWNEYRVLGIRFQYFPGNVVNTATITGFTGYHSLIRGLTTPSPASLSDAASTGISVPWTAFKGWAREWRMADVEESMFQPTASPSATSNALTIYAEGGSASQTYGHLSIMYLVQFRAHTQ